jgi:hypothetical protein
MDSWVGLGFYLYHVPSIPKLKSVVTVRVVDGGTLFVGFHPFRFAWMNLRYGEDGS